MNETPKDIRAELEELEKLYEGVYQTAQMYSKEYALKWFDAHFHDKKHEAELLEQVASWDAKSDAYKDTLWRIKKILGKPYEYLRDNWCCAGCRPSGTNSPGLYG